jgi:DNA-binding CsgD family transcriptional regulator
MKAVQFHLSNVYAKLGVNSRADLSDALGVGAAR